MTLRACEENGLPGWQAALEGEVSVCFTYTDELASKVTAVRSAMRAFHELEEKRTAEA